MGRLCNVRSRFDIKGYALQSTAIVACSAFGVLGFSPAYAQSQPQGPSADQSKAIADQAAGTGDSPAADGGTIVVSGTRIVRDGYTQPTPVTVLGTDQLQTSATPNIADYVNTLPVFMGSSTPVTAGHASSSAGAGLNTLNLRNLGASRTLVLIDGQRSVGSTTTGLVDINTIPQDLIERVDVVTGGASAVYGSDALSGAVNFILNKNFTGFKAEASAGITDYGDGEQWKVGATAGFGFADDRAHFTISGELSGDDGVQGVPRDWNNTGQYYIVNPAYASGNGQPQYIRLSQVTLYNATPGGIIANTALAQTAFGPGGAPYTFHLGEYTSSPYTSGGDWASNPTNSYEDLAPREYNQRIFSRLSYQITDNINLFGQFSWARSHSTNVNEPIFYLGSLPIKGDNAFIPESVAARMTELGITGFNLGTLNGDLPKWTNDPRRTTTRYVLGADGDFGAFGSDWTWNTYYQRGESKILFQALNVPIRARYLEAVDAVRDPDTGTIVCRSTLTDPTNGCVPFNVFGTGVNNQASINYFEPTTPTQNLKMTQDVISADVTGEPFSNWAGPVSLAIGFQHRREAVNATPDANSGTYFAANYGRIKGSYTVTEGSIETVVPLARDQVWAEALDLNAAARLTDYSTSGFVATWKVGATWDIIPGLRIRATRSRDIRAPNLSELFQAGAGGTGPLTDRFFGGTAVTYRIVQQGNLDLQPEEADNTGVGIVLQPGFLPKFNLSVDYWNISIKKSIGLVNSQQIFDLCYQGNSALCDLITPDPSALTTIPDGYVIINQPINLASQKATGIDIEASYGFDLADVVPGLGGELNLRYLGTRYIENRTNNSLTPAVNIVGAALPAWRHNITATYTTDRFTGSLSARITSAGTIDNSYVVCQSSCPASTLFNPTVNDNHRPGATFLDAAFSYDLDEASRYQVFLNVRNLLNTDPPIVPAPYTSIVPYFSPQTNLSLYDVLGRTYRVGIRVSM